MNLNSFSSSWRDKGPVLVTGHTGFKGTWLTLLLMELGLKVIGYSLPPSKDSIFSLIGLDGAIPEVFEDIRDNHALGKFIEKYQPSGIVHLAAQPLVIESYSKPRDTFEINVMGTVNLLEMARKSKVLEAVLVSTTDKVYKNDNTGRRFTESDPLEGVDPYSASKVAVENAIKSWRNRFEGENRIRLIAARAGNVIGGGDLAENRLIPDCVKSCIKNQTLKIRNPESIRPWQHVMEPLVGYILALGYGSSSAYNFGPSDSRDLSVIEVVELLKEKLSFEFELVNGNSDQYESSTLSLDSNLAKNSFGWETCFSQKEAILETGEWWDFYFSGGDIYQKTKSQIQRYMINQQNFSKAKLISSKS